MRGRSSGRSARRSLLTLPGRVLRPGERIEQRFVHCTGCLHPGDCAARSGCRRGISLLQDRIGEVDGLAEEFPLLGREDTAALGTWRTAH